MKKLIHIDVKKNSETEEFYADIDRNYSDFYEGDWIELEFTFPDEWKEYTYRVGTCLNDNKILQVTLKNDMLIVPRQLSKLGELKVIVRGFRAKDYQQWDVWGESKPDFVELKIQERPIEIGLKK